MSRLVPIEFPLTTDVAGFVGRVQSKAYGVVQVDEREIFRQAVRAEARRRGIRVRTGIAAHDSHTVWVCDPNWELSDEDSRTG